MKHVRKLSLLLCLAMLASLVLTGCGSKEKPAPPNESAEAIFLMAIKNDPSKAVEVFGFASESEAKTELMGSDEDPYKEVGEELVSQFEALGATVSSEDAQALIDAVLSMLGKLQYSAEVKDMDEKAGTAVVTSHIGHYDAVAVQNAMTDAMTDVMTNNPDLANDTDAFVSAMIQKMAEVMSSMQPVEGTKDFDTEFTLEKVTVSGKEKEVWIPVDANGFGGDLANAAMGG
jgi:hypothetical protein